MLARVPFQTHEVADLPYQTEENFAFIVPMDSAVMDELQSLRVTKGASELASRQARPATQAKAAMNALRIADLAGGTAQIDWDSTRQPMVLLRDAKTGEVRGFLSGGSAQIANAPASMEIQRSDGVQSTIVWHSRPIAP